MPILRKLKDTQDIRIGHIYTNGGDRAREVIGVWSRRGLRELTGFNANAELVFGTFRIEHVKYRQYVITEKGALESHRHGECTAVAFQRWINNPPRKRFKKCPYCGGTGRV
jgi:NAD-dependent SIR2 family protein deacetylase